MSMQRRDFLKAGAAGLAAGLAGCAALPGAAPKARVAVVGGGYGGATAAKYIRMLDPSIDVVLIEPNAAFVSCRLTWCWSFRGLADITPLHGVPAWVRVSHTATRSKWTKKCGARARAVAFDRVIVSPGIDFCGGPSATAAADGQARLLHAWQRAPGRASTRARGISDGVFTPGLTCPLIAVPGAL